MHTEPAPPPSRRPTDTTSGAPPSPSARRQAGFTLLELLVVVAVLGVLAGAAVLAMGGLRERSEEVACDTDAGTIETAQTAHAVEAGRAGTEAELVAGGYLSEESSRHDVVVGLDGYELVGIGGCASAEETTRLSTGLRIDDAPADAADPRGVPTRPRGEVPCQTLRRGDDAANLNTANRNAAPCADRQNRVPSDDADGATSCGNLSRDTGAANQNPAPCTEQELQQGGAPSDRGRGATPCTPNRSCDTDMAPETVLRR
jgi:prepilin-type N-terminal cleavage/methylation domain-containing protein